MANDLGYNTFGVKLVDYYLSTDRARVNLTSSYSSDGPTCPMVSPWIAFFQSSDTDIYSLMCYVFIFCISHSSLEAMYFALPSCPFL